MNLDLKNMSLAPTPVSLSVRPSVRKSVSDTFGFPFCQRPWVLIAVADMEVDKVADMVADMFADIVH